MRLFTEAPTTYASQANAIKAAEKKLGDAFAETRWIMAVTPEGRFHLVFPGVEQFDMVHAGFCVAG